MTQLLRVVAVLLAAMLCSVLVAIGAAGAGAVSYDGASRPSSGTHVASITSMTNALSLMTLGSAVGARSGSEAASSFAAEGSGGLLSELKGRISAARMGGSDSGAINLGGHEFSDDEIAQLTYQHIGEGDIPGRPSLDEISAALKNGQPVPLPGQNAVQYEYGGVRVIVNGDAPWRSTAYHPGK